MGELVVDRLDVVMVESLRSLLEHGAQIIHTGKEDLLATFSCSKNERSVVPVLKLTDKEEHLREILSGEVNTGDLIIGVNTKILHKVGHDDSLIIIGRYSVIVHVRLVQFEAVLEVNVVRPDIVVVKPFVQFSRRSRLNLDDTVRVEVIFLASRKRQNRKGSD